MSKGRFSSSGRQASELGSRDCFTSSLVIMDLLPADAGNYTLVIENGEGKAVHSVELRVSDPISMTALIGLVSASLVTLVVSLVATAFAYRRRSLCFRGSSISKR